MIQYAPYNFILSRYLPREVDPLVYNMSNEDPGNISYSEIGGLGDQIRDLREVCILLLLGPPSVTTQSVNLMTCKRKSFTVFVK